MLCGPTTDCSSVFKLDMSRMGANRLRGGN